MKNNSSQSRFQKITAKVIVMLLAVVLSLSVLPALSADILPTAGAAEEYVVTTTDITAINNTIANMSSVEIDIKLNNDIGPGLVIPAGKTVNLYMNGKNIVFEHIGKDNGASYTLASQIGIHNKGVLNVYSNGSSNGNMIKLINNRSDMGLSIAKEVAYCNLEGIRNEGTLTLNNGVTITVNSTLHYTKYNGGGSLTHVSSQVACGATGVYNIGSEAVCYVNASTVTAYAFAQGTHNGSCDTGERTDSSAFAYGIYGGDVYVSGKSNVSASTQANHTLDEYFQGDKDYSTCLASFAYGVATTGSVSVTGGTISYDPKMDSSNSVDSDVDGTQSVFGGGIFTTSSDVYIADGTISTPNGDCMANGDGIINYNKGAVVTASALTKSATELVSYLTVYREHDKTFVPATSSITAGSFKDEAGNAYETEATTSFNAVPKAINRGAVAGQNRVHVVYRYWTDSTRKTLDTSIVDADGNKGYSFRPSTSRPTVVNTPVVLTGLSNTKLTVGNNTALRYQNGGDPCNNYYWILYKISYQAAGSTVFSDFSMTQKGTEFQTFESTGATVGQANVTTGPIYIYVDYISKAPTSIRAEVGTSNVVTTTYTGTNILASQIGLKILDPIDQIDITKEYNIDFADNSLIGVEFSFKGTNTAGVEIEDTGRLPRNAGTYEVILKIAESVTYDTDPSKSKNRKALEYKFTLIIEQAEALRGTLPESFSLTYGQKLNEIIAVGTGTYKAGFYGTDNINGTFSFANAGDGSAYKNAGSGITQIKWTPAYGENPVEMNYKTTVFSVSYNVKKAPLKIIPNGATVVYGESDVTFSSVISGLVANDNTEAVQKTIADALVYTVYFNGDYIAYQAGKITAGSHVIRTSFTAPPAVLANYEYTHKYGLTGDDANPDGVLRVTPRGLIVEAVAQDRAYIPGNFDVNVTFSIVSGKFGTDDVRVTSATGALNENCDAGQLKIVNGISADNIKGNLAGAAKNNYEIVTVTYKTGENLLVNIAKAIPDAAIPTVAEMYYLQNRTLADVSLGATTSSVEGSWQWVDSTINPTVKVAQYKAQFVPVENQLKNYEIKVVDVAINVKPTPVTVGYSATVSYGDNIPNITNYTYTSDIDEDFDIKKVTTSGNITPRTDYQKGSPVKAGGYVVTITAPNYVDVDGNYIFTVNNGIINVNPRLITFTVEDKTIVYGDSFNVDATGAVTLTYDESLLVGTDTINSITASGVAPAFGFETDFNSFNNYNAGTYTINATCTSSTSANYTVAVVPGTLYVTKAPLVIKANDFTLEYGSDVPANLASALTLNGVKRNEKLEDILTSGSINVNTEYVKGSPVKAGGYEVTVGIAGATFRNYEVTVQNGTITVIKATPVITTLPTAEITYGQTLADAVFSGQVIAGDIPGTFVYENATIAPAYSDNSYNSFTASFVPEDTDNYNVIRGKIVSLVVNKKTVTGILSVAGVPMIGEKLTVDVAGLDPNTAGSYSFVWYDENGNVLGTGAELPLGEDSANKKIKVTATAATPYQGDVTSNLVLIAPELTDINAILTKSEYKNYFTLTGIDFDGSTTLQYSAQQKFVDFKKLDSDSAKYEIGNITVKYNGSTEAPVNVGRYAVTIDVATPTDLAGLTEANGVVTNSKGAVVYSPVSNFLIGYLEITPMGYTVYVEVDEKTYDGTVDATATVVEEIGKIQLTGGGYDDVWFDNNAVTYYFDTPDAGTQKSVNAFDGNYLKGTAADNYELVIIINNADSAVIKPMPLNVTVSAVEREYIPGNKNVDLAFDFTPAEGDEGFVYVDASKAKGTISGDAAGSYYVTVSDVELIGSKAANYELVIKDADKILAVITKATPSYPIPEVHDVLYYDSGRYLNKISLGDSHWKWVEPNAVPGAGVHTFKAIYTPDDQANYTTVEYDVEVEVLKTRVTITAASFTITYGDTEPTYYYIAEGLTGADTIDNAVDGYVLMNCNYQPGSKIGEYVIQLDGAFESDNYDFIYNNGTVTVGKRTAYVDVIAENREYKEGDKTVQVKFSALENLFSGDSASDVYLQYTNYITGTIADADAGTKTVQYEMPKLLGTKAENYIINAKKAVVTVEILKASIPGVILPTSGVVYYGNKLSTIEFTSGSEGAQYGTFTMENPSSTPEKVGTFDRVYKVVFTPFDTKNYATITQFITVEVLPAFINVSVHFTGTIQVGKTLYVILNDIPSEAIPNLVFEWYRVDTPESDPRTGVKVASGTDSYQLTAEDSGKYIMCSVTNADGSPYECNAICVTDIAVEEQQLTFWQKFVNWFYRLISNFTQIFGGMLG